MVRTVCLAASVMVGAPVRERGARPAPCRAGAGVSAGDGEAVAAGEGVERGAAGDAVSVGPGVVQAALPLGIRGDGGAAEMAVDVPAVEQSLGGEGVLDDAGPRVGNGGSVLVGVLAGRGDQLR